MGALTAAAVLGGAAIGAGANFLASRAQAGAAKDAQKTQAAEAQRAREFAAQQADAANGIISQSSGQAADALRTGYSAGTDALTAGNSAAARALGQARGDTLAALQGGYAQANQTIQGGMGGAQQQLQQGYGAAQGALSPLLALQGYGAQAAQAVGTNSRLDALLGGNLSRENAYAGFEADPGYQFRRQQGEDAIRRAASAQGGRLGAGTLQALTDYNQNLASNEFDRFAQRRSGLNALQAQGAQAADQSQLQAALQAQSNQMGLAGIGYQAQGQSADLHRLLGGQLAGITSGGAQAQAANQTAQGTQEAQYGAQNGANLANLLATGGQQLAAMQTGMGAGLANIFGNAGANQASNLTGVGNSNTQLSQALMPGYMAGVPYAGAGWASLGTAAGQGLNNLAFLATLSGYGGAPASQNGFGPEWARIGNLYYR